MATMNQRPLSTAASVFDLGLDGGVDNVQKDLVNETDEQRKRRLGKLTDQTPRDIVSPAVFSLFGIGNG